MRRRLRPATVFDAEFDAISCRGHEERARAPPFGGDEARASFEAARVAIPPVPYEGTVSYGGGAANGPAAILHASTQVELYDEQLPNEPFRVGVWTMPCFPIEDRPAHEAVGLDRGTLRQSPDAGKWSMLGGEHSITPGAVAAVEKRHPGLQVVQLDAHADLRETYQGNPTAMRARWRAASSTPRSTRSGSATTRSRRRSGSVKGFPVPIVHGWEMEGEAWIERILAPLEGLPVYLTIDVDYFDPSVIPATGTPEPGGGSWWPTLRFLSALFRRASVVGCDVVELAPVPGLHHADFTTARLVYKLIGFLAAGSP